MADPRNVAHDKKVLQEKKGDRKEPVAGAAETSQPGKKPAIAKTQEHQDPASERVAEAKDKAESEGLEPQVPAPKSV